MAKILDVRQTGGQFVVLGESLVLPYSSNATSSSGQPTIAGAIRYNPTTDKVETVSMAFGWSVVGDKSAWNNVSANTALVATGRYLANTLSNAITLSLPATASLGDEIIVRDAAGTFAARNCTIAPNGLTIRGSSNAAVLSTTWQEIRLVYTGSTWSYA